jgi:hypothetical protein
MDISTIQIVVYVAVIIGALAKIYSKGRQLGSYDFFTKAHLLTLVIALAVTIYIASEVMTNIAVPASFTGLTIAFLVTALLAGWGSGDAAYNGALLIIADLQSQNPASPADTSPSQAPQSTIPTTTP